LDFKNLSMDVYTIAECDKQATVVGLSLITLGDGGRGHVLSAVDRRPSIVDHTHGL